MLIIRDEQMDVLGLSATAAFGRTVLSALFDDAPEAMLGLGEAEVSQRLDRALEWAKLLDIRVARDLRAFIRLSFLIGPDFCSYEPFESLLMDANGRMEGIFGATGADDWNRVAIEEIVGRYYLDQHAAGMDGIEQGEAQITLSVLGPEHANDVHYFGLHPDVWRLAGAAPALSLADVLRDIEEARQSRDREQYAVHSGTCGFAGVVALTLVDSALELSYWIRRDQWGKGMATAAIQTLWKQSQLLASHSAVLARCAADNLLSLGVLFKTGFTPEPADDTANLLCFSHRLDKY